MTAQWRVTRAIGCKDIFLENFSANGAKIGRTFEDVTSPETLEMQRKNGVTLPQWVLPQFQAPLKERSYFVVPHRMGGNDSLNGRGHRFAFGRIVGEEKERGPGGKLEGCWVTGTRLGRRRVNQPSSGAMEDQCASSVSDFPQFDTSIGRVDHEIDAVSKGGNGFGQFEWDKTRHGVGPHSLFHFED